MNKYVEVLENIGMLDLDEESNGYDNPKYLKDFYFGEYCILQELVEKATPKKPVKYILGYFSEDDSREKDVYVDCCPNCDEIVDKEFCYMEYCPHCGQMLLWEGEEDE